MAGFLRINVDAAVQYRVNTDLQFDAGLAEGNVTCAAGRLSLTHGIEKCIDV
jgi:hypothetical protein